MPYTLEYELFLEGEERGMGTLPSDPEIIAISNCTLHLQSSVLLMAAPPEGPYLSCPVWSHYPSP